MMRAFAHISFVALLSGAAFGQSTPTKPAFQIADVHVSAHARNPTMQGGVFRSGRYELRQATMLDLIKTAYGVDPETVVGGPSWLESDRFDVVAKAPPATSAETVNLMLQELLTDRFKLVVHKDMKLGPRLVLTVGKGKPKMKETDGSGEAGCQGQPPTPPSPDTIPLQVFSCRNMTMAAFAAFLLRQAPAYLTSPVLDSTGIKGAWDFDVKWTMKGMLSLAGTEGITVFDAVDKQLGLKLEPQMVPIPVLIVDSVNQKPTANSPGVMTSLPSSPAPEFEVASVRPSGPGTPIGGGGLQPGGRYEVHGFPLLAMIRQAWDINTPPGEEIPGTPKWLNRGSPLFDIVATVPAAAIASGTRVYDDDLRAMMRALLVDRFKMVTHYEDRPMDAYTLVADKPKLKKADPSNRTGCKWGPSGTQRNLGDGPTTVATCQNVTMSQFVEQLQNIAPTYIGYPVLDATGIDGAWDFTLTFSAVNLNLNLGAGARGGGPPSPGAGGLSDPNGELSLFNAIDKQLGLKLEMHKRPEPLFVIDHIEEKPTDN
jgi:uncharacterized protein (TIGR03435 family)